MTKFGILSAISVRILLPNIFLHMASFSAMGADISVKNNVGSGSRFSYEIFLSNPIERGDGKKFKNAIDDAITIQFKKENPDYNDEEVRMNVGNMNPSIALYLNSEGGLVGEAIKIIEAVKARNIETFVKSNASCKSACAFIFLAGNHAWPYEDPQPSRTLEVGGKLAFHAPYVRGPGTFRRGREIVAALINELGEALPGTMFKEIMSKGPDEYIEIETVEQIVKWNISITGFTIPWPTRLGYINACRYFMSYNKKIPVHGIYLRTNGNDPADESEVIPDDDEDLEEKRAFYHAPDLFHLRWLKNGRTVSQVAFNHYDEQGVFWCTAWTRGKSSYDLYAADRIMRITKNNLNDIHLNRATPLPIWYQYSPSTKIIEIKSYDE